MLISNMENQSTFTEDLAIAIAKSGKRKKEIAEEVGIHPTSLSYFLSGKRDPSVLVLRKLAAALEITFADLTRNFQNDEPQAAAKTPATATRDKDHKEPVQDEITIEILNLLKPLPDETKEKVLTMIRTMIPFLGS